MSLFDSDKRLRDWRTVRDCRDARSGGSGAAGCKLPNLLISTDFADPVHWIQQGLGGAASPVVTANAATAPDGMMTATRFDFPSVGGGQSSDIYQEIVTPLTQDYTFSFYLRGRTGSGILKVFFYDGSLGAAVEVPFTTSWQRISVTRHLLGTSHTDFAVGFSATFPDGEGGPVSIYLWHPMVNVGDMACRYKEPA